MDQWPIRYAEHFDRIAALVVDLIVLGVIYIMYGLWLIGVMQDTQSNPFAATIVRFDESIMTLLVILYFTVLESSRYQATLGKRIVSIKITRLNGGHPSFLQVLVRNVLKVALGSLTGGLIYLTALFDERRQCIHDKLAKTLVVRR